MRRFAFVAAGLVVSVVLGATVFRQPIVWAAQAVDAMIVAPLDGSGNLKVHEQGTANVSITNTSPIPVSEGETTVLGALSHGTSSSGSFSFDVSSARDVRLMVQLHTCIAHAQVTVRMDAESASPAATASVIVDEFNVPCTLDDGVTRLYELPGQEMTVSFQGNSGVIDFIALGRAN